MTLPRDEPLLAAPFIVSNRLNSGNAITFKVCSFSPEHKLLVSTAQGQLTSEKVKTTTIFDEKAASEEFPFRG